MAYFHCGPLDHLQGERTGRMNSKLGRKYYIHKLEYRLKAHKSNITLQTIHYIDKKKTKNNNKKRFHNHSLQYHSSMMMKNPLGRKTISNDYLTSPAPPSMTAPPWLLQASWLLPCIADTAVGGWMYAWMGEFEAIMWPLVKKATYKCNPFTMSYVNDHTVLFSAEVYVMGILFCLGIFLSFYLLTFLMACLDNRRYAPSLSSVSLWY